MKDNDIELMFNRFSYLMTDRASYETSWDSIIEYTNPQLGYVQRDDKNNNIETEQIFDNTADKNLQRLAAILSSMLTGQFTQWFKVETDDDDFNEDSAGKEWLEKVTDILTEIFDNSNFYTQAPKFYYDLPNVGTATVYIEADTRPGKIATFSTRHIKEIYLAEDKYGDIDVVYRRVYMTARQVVQRWGEDTVSEKIKEMYKNKPETEVYILHCVFPREDYDIKNKSSKEMPYASFWFEYDTKQLLQESGYKELPYAIARWEVPTGRVYGVGPMNTALPTVRSLNRMEKIKLEAAELAVRPPLKGSPDLSDYQEEIILEPDRVVIIDPQRQGILEPIWIPTGIPFTYQESKELREQIIDQLLGDKLQMIDKSKMTAAEVRARTAENSKVIGPTFGRIRSEFLEKIIERVYSIALESVDMNGEPILPEPPIKPNGKMKVRFVSPLAKAQRISELQGIFSTIEYAMGIAEARPEVLDNIDFDASLRLVSEIQDTPGEVLVDEKLVKKIREARQQQQQQMQKMQKMQIQQQQQAQQAKTNKDNASAGKDVATARKTDEEV